MPDMSQEGYLATLGMKAFLEEGQETIEDGENQDELTADLALIAVATLLSHTLGEEETSDFLLTAVVQSLLPQAISAEFGNGTKARGASLVTLRQKHGRPKPIPRVRH